MRAKIISIREQPSFLGQSFFYIFFKGDDGKSYRTCAYPQYGNYPRWCRFIEKYRQGQEVWLDGLMLQAKGLIDADSYPQEVTHAVAA